MTSNPCSIQDWTARCCTSIRAGAILSHSRGEPTTLKITNVNSHSLGVIATDPATKRPRNAVVIPRNTPLPITAKRIFKTQKANQKSILVRIIEGENATPDECTYIGECTVSSLPPNLAAQTPINVRFRYKENGRLSVMVRVEGTDVELKHEMTRENSLNKKQLDTWREYVSRIPAS